MDTYGALCRHIDVCTPALNRQDPHFKKKTALKGGSNFMKSKLTDIRSRLPKRNNIVTRQSIQIISIRLHHDTSLL